MNEKREIAGKQKKLSEETVRIGVLIVVLIFICLVFSLLTDTFLSLSTLSNIIRQISVQSIIAVGMTYVILTGNIDLSVGTGLMFSGVIAAMTLTYTGNELLGIIACIGVSVLVGGINGFVVGYFNIPPFMATLAMQSICRGLGWTLSGANRIMVSDYKGFIWLGQTDIQIGKFDLPASFFAILIVYLVAIITLKWTTLGRKVYAVGGNPVAARASGINVPLIKLITFVIAGLSVGLAAIISVGRTVSSQPQAGNGMEFDAITATVIGGTSLMGGTGNLGGTLIGATMVGVISFGLGQMDISPYAQYIVKGAVILVAIALDADGYLMSFLRNRIALRRQETDKTRKTLAAAEGKNVSEFDRFAEHKVLEMQGINKSFSGVQVLKDIDFRIERGKVHALCGENGAGKSTLIKILGGTYTKDSGSVQIDGVPYEINSVQDAQKIGISVIYQELSLVPELTVAQNIYLGREIMAKSGVTTDTAKMNELAHGYMSKLGLDIDVTRKVKNLTVAQQQMVELAKVYASNAWVIVMDEPTSAITENEKENLFKIIAELKRQDIAIIYISHRMPEIFEIADELTVLRDGRHVCTTSMEGVTEDDIIRWMVGRELKDVYEHSKRTNGDVVLEVKNLTKKGVFENISFQVHAGEVLGVSGLIGAGRTEVMRCVFGLDAYDSGEIRFMGKPVRFRYPLQAISAGIALVPEDRRRESIIPHMSVLENMELVSLPWIAKHGFVNTGETGKIFQEYVGRFSIKMASMAQHITFLSGGNQQKAILGKWLARNPNLLILDEPTRGIDVGAKADIYKLIDDLAQEGKAVIMISSEMPEILGVSDNILVLFEGHQTALLKNEEGLDQEEIMRYATGNGCTI